MNMQDVENIESGDPTEEEFFCSVQRAINSHSWSLQGSYGRTMMGAINSGHCMLGTKPCLDYWGNRIPSRFEVQEGTKGSRGYVISHRGEDWATMLEGV